MARPTATPKAPPTYTHTGYRPSTGHRCISARMYSHDAPRPGKVHALNVHRPAGGPLGYAGLCGEAVHATYEDDGGWPRTNHVGPKPDGEPGRDVSCKRCRRALGLIAAARRRA